MKKLLVILLLLFPVHGAWAEEFYNIKIGGTTKSQNIKVIAQGLYGLKDPAPDLGDLVDKRDEEREVIELYINHRTTEFGYPNAKFRISVWKTHDLIYGLDLESDNKPHLNYDKCIEEMKKHFEFMKIRFSDPRIVNHSRYYEIPFSKTTGYGLHTKNGYEINIDCANNSGKKDDLQLLSISILNVEIEKIIELNHNLSIAKQYPLEPFGIKFGSIDNQNLKIITKRQKEEGFESFAFRDSDIFLVDPPKKLEGINNYKINVSGNNIHTITAFKDFIGLKGKSFSEIFNIIDEEIHISKIIKTLENKYGRIGIQGSYDMTRFKDPQGHYYPVDKKERIVVMAIHDACSKNPKPPWCWVASGLNLSILDYDIFLKSAQVFDKLRKEKGEFIIRMVSSSPKGRGLGHNIELIIHSINEDLVHVRLDYSHRYYNIMANMKFINQAKEDIEKYIEKSYKDRM